MLSELTLAIHRMKTLLRNVIADTVCVSGVSGMLRRTRRRSLAILCYHRVLPQAHRDESAFPDLAVTPEAFERHIEHCSRRYECVALREGVRKLAESRSANRASHRPLVSITFDDGYRDNFECARPILDSFGVRGTFFVISSLVDTDDSPWYDRLAGALRFLRGRRDGVGEHPAIRDESASGWLKTRLATGDNAAIPVLVNEVKAFSPETRSAIIEASTVAATELGWDGTPADRIMSADQLRTLASSGHEIGSHTHTHPRLTQLSSIECLNELQESQRLLESILDAPVQSLAYPNGDCNQSVAGAAAAAGYQYAVTTHPGLNGPQVDPLRLCRVHVSQERTSRLSGACSTNILELELAGLADTVFLRGRAST